MKNPLIRFFAIIALFSSTSVFAKALNVTEAKPYVGYFTAVKSKTRTVDAQNSAKYEIRSVDGKSLQIRIREHNQKSKFFQATPNKGESFHLDTGWLNTVMHVEDPSMIRDQYKRMRKERKDSPQSFDGTKNALLEALARKQVAHVIYITTKSSEKGEALRGNPNILEIGVESCSIFYTLAVYVDKSGSPLFLNFHVNRDYGMTVNNSVLLRY